MTATSHAPSPLAAIGPPAVSVRDVEKSFGVVCALHGVSFDVRRGEIHALVGENGAGKSTLVKILSGVHRPDAGELWLDGQPAMLAGARDAAAAGVATVHQEPVLCSDLSVLENMFLGRELRRRSGMLDWRRMRDVARGVCARLSLRVGLDTPVGELPVADRKLVQIGRALCHDARLLILDEPTAALTGDAAELLLGLLGRLRADGVAILYVSHRLDEIFTITDRITVLRDGEWIATRQTGELDPATLVRLMIGRPLRELTPRTATVSGRPMLVLRGLSRRGAFSHVDLCVRAGEIVGLAGLVGAGRSDVAQTVFGLEPADAGTLEIDGEPATIHSPWQALQRGIAYVPEDRPAQGVFATRPITENVTMPILRRLSHWGLMRRGAERRLAGEYARRLAIKAPNTAQLMGRLSGGNQQKVILSRWLATDPKVLILDEPTQGIDIGAKAEVHQLINELAGAGMAILLISSEMLEVLGMSDRIVVMREGRVAGELTGAEATEERVLSLAAGVAEAGTWS